jgi:hypothetical protein
MSKPKTGKAADKKGLLAKFFGMVTTDADPEVVAEIAEQLVEAVEETTTASVDKELAAEPAKEPATEPLAEKKDESSNGEVMALLKSLVQEVADMKASIADMRAGDKKDSDPLKELEQEIGGEEEVTKPVEEIDEKDKGADGKDEPAVDTESSMVEPAGEEAGSKATADQVRDAIANAKKTVAAIKDENTRRTVADAMAGLIRQSYGIKPSTPKGSYALIQAAKKGSAQKANDGVATFDNMEARQEAYDKRNPHIKKEGGK